MQQAIQAAKAGDWSEADGVVTAGGSRSRQGSTTSRPSSEAGEADAVAAAVLPGGGFVLLDTTLTPELEAEGLARDVIRPSRTSARTPGST